MGFHFLLFRSRFAGIGWLSYPVLERTVSQAEGVAFLVSRTLHRLFRFLFHHPCTGSLAATPLSFRSKEAVFPSALPRRSPRASSLFFGTIGGCNLKATEQGWSSARSVFRKEDRRLHLCCTACGTHPLSYLAHEIATFHNYYCIRPQLASAVFVFHLCSAKVGFSFLFPVSRSFRKKEKRKKRKKKPGSRFSSCCLCRTALAYRGR